MDGWELARLARQHDPCCAILYVTGDSAHRWAANGVPRSVMQSKPFAPAQLVEAVTSSIIQGPLADRVEPSVRPSGLRPSERVSILAEPVRGSHRFEKDCRARLSSSAAAVRR
jgi:hypothetical protein